MAETTHRGGGKLLCWWEEHAQQESHWWGRFLQMLGRWVGRSGYWDPRQGTMPIRDWRSLLVWFFFFGWENQSLLFFWGGSLVTRLQVETSKQLYSWCWWNFNADLERLLHWVIFFWDLQNDMCRYLSRFFPIKLSALVGQVRFLANFKISRLFLLLPRTPTGPA